MHTNLFTGFILIYFCLLNVIALLAMGIDKYKAKKHLWRIPEKTLFLLAILGGSIGSIFGMYFFHHKTKHKTFVLGMPSILFVQIVSLLILFFVMR